MWWRVHQGVEANNEYKNNYLEDYFKYKFPKFGLSTITGHSNWIQGEAKWVQEEREVTHCEVCQIMIIILILNI